MWKTLRDENLAYMEAKEFKTPSGTMVTLSSKESLHEKTIVYPLCYHIQELNLDTDGPIDAKTSIELLELDTLEAAKIQVEKGYKTVILCFASTREPGGAFSTGEAGTQEEEICYRSTLGGFMKQQELLFCDGHFPLADNVDDPRVSNHIPNKVILTPDVQVFRDGGSYELMEMPFEVGVLSCAAVVHPSLTDAGTYENKKQRDLMEALIRTQLLAAKEGGYDSVILGAFGCGAFRNPPKEVASIYMEVIRNEFPQSFQSIIFAVLGQVNYLPFQQVYTSWDSECDQSTQSSCNMM